MNSEDFPEVTLFFRFYGPAFDPAEITHRLGIQPTAQWRAGDPKSVGTETVHRRHDAWMMRVADRETIEIGDMLEELQEQVNVPGNIVKQICAELGVRAVVVCGVIQSPEGPSAALEFPADFLDWTAALGASINVDVI
jgi:hypothetical protein